MTTSEILISVIIPTYNYAHLLPRALDSALRQQAEDVELIVVNDGSTDHTSELLAGYSAKYPRLHIVEKSNGGAASARNCGIRFAHGRYALMLDADDELLPNALAILREVILAAPAVGMVLGAYFSVYPDGRERLRAPTPVPKLSVGELAKQYLLEKRISISHCCSLFRRDLLLQRLYPESLRNGEDIAVFAYLLVSAPVALTNEPLARIFKHHDSLRHQRDGEESRALEMVEQVFVGLPEVCQPLRNRYESQRYLSLFRAALIDSDMRSARRFYRKAFTLAPMQALRWSYLRKAIRLLLRNK
jgi:glycosyltransferase involved in cell wall biosynthesis